MKANKRTNKNKLSKQTQNQAIGRMPDLPAGITSVIPGGCFPMSLYGGLAREACRLLREGKSATEARAILDAKVMERARAATKALAEAQESAAQYLDSCG